VQPYSTPKDILYLAIVPDSVPVLKRARVFFTELCKTYEQHRLGRHLPLSTSKSAAANMPVTVGLARVDVQVRALGAERPTARQGVDGPDKACGDPWFDDEQHPHGFAAELKQLTHLSVEQKAELTAQVRWRRVL